jgi:hypothetical protein
MPRSEYAPMAVGWSHNIEGCTVLSVRPSSNYFL